MFFTNELDLLENAILQLIAAFVMFGIAYCLQKNKIQIKSIFT